MNASLVLLHFICTFLIIFFFIKPEIQCAWPKFLEGIDITNVVQWRLERSLRNDLDYPLRDSFSETYAFLINIKNFRVQNF